MSLLSAVQIILRNKQTTHKYIINVAEEDTILSLKTKLSIKSGLDTNLMKILFCGRKLDENLPVKTLHLGPQTNLIVIIERQKQEINLINNLSNCESFLNNNIYSSFFVFCKKCADIKRGKLRAYCTECQSSSIVFTDEPSCWNDVLGYKKLKIFCNECECTQSALINFKCFDCGENSCPLTHIHRNYLNNAKTCEVCGESGFPIFIKLFDCIHICCLDCFKSYATQILEHKKFIMKPSIGFTIACPVYECSGYIADIHHFYLLGINAYNHFHHVATELYIAQQQEHQYCPAPNCGAAFFLDSDEDDKMVLCPECAKLFCRICQSITKCKCHEIMEDESFKLIRQTTKNCPKCNVSTERDGGCSHIHCTQCNFEWCFICENDWSTECQWDHWFD